MTSYTVVAEIAAEPATVFGAVADLPSHGRWSADPVTIERIDGDGGPGTRYRSTARSKGKEFTAELEVTERRAPDRFAFRVVDATGSWEHVFSLAAAGSGTRVERRITGTLSLPQAVLFYAVLPIVKRPSARASLAKLKEQLEAGA